MFKISIYGQVLMFDIRLTDIGPETIHQLIENEIPEGRQLDYKETLPGNSDSSKKEFLADVTSFANASGGDIVFGIREKRDGTKSLGIPESICPLQDFNADSEILRLESIIRDGAAPRLGECDFWPISVDGGHLLILRIQKSWQSPHMVTLKGGSRFFSRTSNGKFILDVHELRSAFAMSSGIPEMARSFREDRVWKVLENNAPLEIKSGPTILLHLVPLSNSVGNVSILDIASQRIDFPQIMTRAFSQRPNLDGYLWASQSQDAPCGSYTQLFRNGTVECFDTDLISPWHGHPACIPSGVFEQNVVATVRTTLEKLDSVGVFRPFVVFLTLLRVKGLHIETGSPGTGRAIDRDTVALPEALINDATPVETCMKDTFDTLWQAAGYQRSFNYDGDGKWNPVKR